MDAYRLEAFTLDRPERLRAHLARSRRVYEARPDGQGGCHWQTVAADDTTPFAPPTEPPPFSAKAFFFAEREALFRFEAGRFLPVLPVPEPQVLFGLQACDLVAVAYQDQFFAHDPHYQVRRAATLLVGFDCARSCTHGFCATVDSGPEVRAGTADLVLVPSALEWRLLIASEAGRAAVQGLALAPAASGWQTERSAQAARVALAQGHNHGIRAGIDALNAGTVRAETWERLGLQCLACSGCTSVCPTCSCFAPLDRTLSREQNPPEGGVLRERVWDSCLYEGFQKEASGQNASATPGDRVRRFWFHKFGDGYKQRFGRYGCVGCGRCDCVCPGGIGVHAVMKRIGQA